MFIEFCFPISSFTVLKQLCKSKEDFDESDTYVNADAVEMRLIAEFMQPNRETW